jgi:hypothetical protein
LAEYLVDLLDVADQLASLDLPSYVWSGCTYVQAVEVGGLEIVGLEIGELGIGELEIGELEVGELEVGGQEVDLGVESSG